MTLKRELLELRERVERVVVLGDVAGAEAIDSELRAALRPGGVLAANLPEDPRVALPRGRPGERKLEVVLRDFFGEVARVEEDLGEELELGDGRATAAVLWVCR